MSHRIIPAAAAALALAACNPEFDPASQVDGMRVLAVRAEPPEIAPHGDPDALHTSALTSLVLRPDWTADPARQTTVVYLACAPVPGVPAPSPCVMLASLRDPTADLAEAAEASCGDPEPPSTVVPPPISFAGAEVCDRASAASGCRAVDLPGGGSLPPPALSLPESYGVLFDGLLPEAPERILGVEAQVLAFAVDATPAELADGADAACPLRAVAANLARLWDERDHVLSVKRVQIRGPDAPAEDDANQNPAIDAVSAGGASLDPLAPTTVTGGTISLRPVLPDGAVPQLYTERDSKGVALERVAEEWVYSWFSTAGELDVLHTRGDEAEEWKAIPPPGGSTAIVAAVVRDHRGGVAWAVHDVMLVP